MAQARKAASKSQARPKPAENGAQTAIAPSGELVDDTSTPDDAPVEAASAPAPAPVAASELDEILDERGIPHGDDELSRRQAVQRLQRELRTAGLYDGPRHGHYDEATRSAALAARKG